MNLVPDALAVLMNSTRKAQEQLLLPPIISQPKNGRERMANALANLFIEQKWSMSASNQRKYDVFNRLEQCLWTLNLQQKKFADRHCDLPQFALQFLNFRYKKVPGKSVPGKGKVSAGNLSTDALRSHYASLSHLIEVPLLQTAPWQGLLEAIVSLAGSLKKYFSYLGDHIAYASEHRAREHSTPVLGGKDDSLFVIPVVSQTRARELQSGVNIPEIQRIQNMLADLPFCSPLDLSDFQPADVLVRRTMFTKLKAGALYSFVPDTKRIVLYDIRYNNNLGTRHFLWLIDAADRDNSADVMERFAAPMEACRNLIKKYAGPLQLRNFINCYSGITKM